MKTDSHNPMEELLNAYHDGQLDEQEAAEVERLLETDARAKLLLDQIAQTSQRVRQLPRAEAPESLRDDIRFQLERDQLLNPQPDRLGRMGRTHLRLRWLTAAAAVILLAGAVATVIYSVVITPSAGELTTQPQNLVDHTALPQDLPVVEPDFRFTAADTQKAMAALLEDAPRYSQLHIVVHPVDRNESLWHLEAALTQHRIDRFVRLPVDDDRIQYAFYCPLDRLRPFVHHVVVDSRYPVDIVVSGADDQAPVVITQADESQILAFAAADSAQQLALVRRWQNDLENPLPDWLKDTFAQAEPQISNLRILGPAEPGSDSVDKRTPLVANRSQPDPPSDKTNGGQPDDEPDRTTPAVIDVSEKKRSPAPPAPDNPNVAVVLTCKLP